MFELVQVAENTYYVESPAKIGIYRVSDEEVVLIDSGNDKEAGRKIRQILDSKGWKLKTIYNTHANADHIGGNRYLQNQTGCKIFIPEMNLAFTRKTILEPAFLYGGYPPKELRKKFLMAQESDAEFLLKDDLPKGFDAIELPGHFFDMVGYRTPDNIIFLADCLFSKEILDKYKISFIYDVADYLKTLEMVKGLEAELFIPSHSEATTSIKELAQYNIDQVKEIGEKILSICSEPLNFEVILKNVFSDYQLDMNFDQYVLVGSTVRSYMAWLKDAGKLDIVFKDNLLLWKTVEF